MKRDLSPIVISGLHRSGTTWVGNVVANARGTQYLHEPFNVNQSDRYPRVGLKQWYTYIDQQNVSFDLERKLERVVSFRYPTGEQLRYDSLASVIKKTGRFAYARALGLRPIVKDPIAFFSLNYLAQRFDANIVIVIRHPAAFVGSLKVKGWKFCFRNLTRQDRLVETYLSSFVDEMNELDESFDSNANILQQGCLLWRMFAHVVTQHYQQNADWQFVKHEDLSANPQQGFKVLFERLDIDFSKHVAAFIDRTTSGHEKGRVFRDSASNIKLWKERLSAAEINKIYEATSTAAADWYGESDW